MNSYEEMTERLIELHEYRYYGKYRGIVMDNNDPTNSGMLQVKVPSVFSEKHYVWAIPCTPFGGKEMGIFMIPDKDAGVWIEFERGDSSLPLWTGCYWSDKESPKDNKTDQPKVRLIKSATGLTISLDDDGKIITISDKNKNNTVSIDVNAGKVTVKGSSTVSVEAQSILLGGDAAIEPVVKGNMLMTYLTTLIASVLPNPSNPPQPPIPAMLLSNVVKTK